MKLIEKTFDLGEGKSITVRKLRSSEIRKLQSETGPTMIRAGEGAAQMYMAELAIRMAITGRTGLSGEPVTVGELGKVQPEEVYDEIPRPMIADIVAHTIGDSEEEKTAKGN